MTNSRILQPRVENSKQSLDAHLATVHVAVSDVLALPICTICQTTLGSKWESITGHFTGKHVFPSHIPPLSHFQKSYEKRVQLVPDHPHRGLYLKAQLSRPVTLDAIPELGIKPGFKCPLCPSKYVSKKDSLRRHFRYDHQRLPSQAEFHPVPYLQTVSRNPIRYFPVHPPRNSAENSPVLSSLSGTSPQVPVDRDTSFLQKCLRNIQTIYSGYDPVTNVRLPDFQAEISSDDRQIDSFMVLSNFHKILKKWNFSLIFRYVAPPTQSIEKLVSIQVERYLEYASSIIYLVPDFILHAILGQVEKNNSFHPVGPETIKKYAAFISRALLMLIRRLTSQEFSTMPELPPDLLSSTQRFLTCLHALQQARTSHQSKPVEEPKSSDIWFSTPIAKSLHSLSKCLCLCRLPQTAPVSKIYLRWFAVFSCVIYDASSGEYLTQRSHDLSQPFAIIQFYIRATALLRIHTLPEGPQFDRIYEATISALQPDKNTAFAVIRGLLDKAWAIAGSTRPEPRFVLCNRHDDCYLVDGVEFPFDSYKKSFHRLLGETRKLLHDEILFSYPIPQSLLNALESPADDTSCAVPGYTFISANSALNDAKNQLMLFVWKRPLLRARFISSDSTNKGAKRWNRSAIFSWLSHCVRFQQKLLALVHIVGGAPPRATEEMTHKIHNTLPNTLRSVYMYQDFILLLLRYNKTRHLSQSDRPIPRFLDLETGCMFKLYIVLARPLELLFLQDFCPNNLVRIHRDYLFVEQGRAFDARKVRTAVAAEFRQVGIPFSLSQFRQYSTNVLRLRVSGRSSRQLENPDNSLDLLAVAQAGHNEGTANRNYACGDGDLRTIEWSDIQDNLRVSVETHLALEAQTRIPKRLGSSMTLCTSEHPTHCDAQSRTDIIRAACKSISDSVLSALSEGSQRYTHSPPNPVPSNTVVSASCGEALGHSRSLLLKRHSQSALDISEPDEFFLKRSKTCEPTNRTHYTLTEPATSLKEYNSALVHLRAFFRSPPLAKVSFKSPVQLKAFHLALERKQDMLVILPTGGGKSLIFMLCSYVEPLNSVTIVIVPIFALIDDLVARCAHSNLPAGTWKDRNKANVRLIIIPIEVVGSQEYTKLVGRLANQGKLGRFVFDEAHLSLQWNSFRDSLNSLGTLIRPEGCFAPLLLLSATVPPSKTHLIPAHLGAQNLVILREKTTRANLSYEVEDYTGISSSSPADLLHERGVSFLQKEMKSLKSLERVIVYCVTRKEAEKFLERLQGSIGVSEALLYHGGLSRNTKTDVMNTWRDNHSVKIMVATSAFGLGIDFPGVRTVMHLGFSRSLVEFAQESGRAGRDGARARSLVLFSDEYLEENIRIARSLALEWADGATSTYCKTTFPATSTASERAQDLGILGFRDWAKRTETCRRSILQTYLDGMPETCLFLPAKSGSCDNCDPSISSTPYSEVRSKTDHSFASSHQKELSTVGRNVVRNAEQSQNAANEAVQAVLEFKQNADSLKQMGCVACYVDGGYPRRGCQNKCKRMRGRCLRCFQAGHSVKDVGNSPSFNARPQCKIRFKDTCYKCGLGGSYLFIPLHASRDSTAADNFGECAWTFALDIVLYLWGSIPSQKWIVAEFPDTSSFRTSAAGFADFQKWLFSSAATPLNLFKVFNSWTERRSKKAP